MLSRGLESICVGWEENCGVGSCTDLPLLPRLPLNQRRMSNYNSHHRRRRIRGMSWLRPQNRAYEKVEGRDMSQRLLKGKLERDLVFRREKMG